MTYLEFKFKQRMRLVLDSPDRCMYNMLLLPPSAEFRSEAINYAKRHMALLLECPFDLEERLQEVRSSANDDS